MKNLFSYLLIGLTFLTSSAVHSASVIGMSVEDLTVKSDQIFVGSCKEKTSLWVDEKIFTHYTFSVDQQIKGSESNEITVKVAGGTAKHPRLNFPVTMNVPGNVGFDIGEEVVIFLAKNTQGEYQIVGLTQGKFQVETDSVTGEKVIATGPKKLTNKQEEPLVIDDFLEDEDHVDLSTRKITLKEFVDKLEKLIQKP